MFIDLIKQQIERQEDISPDIALTGGASCPPKLFHDMKKFLNVKKVKVRLNLNHFCLIIQICSL